MSSWRYEIYLLVLIISYQHEKIKFVSPSGHVISSIFVPVDD